MSKLGSNVTPFRFKMPENAPSSVILQDGTSDLVDACGVQYYVKIFAGESETDHNRAKYEQNRRVTFVFLAFYFYTFSTTLDDKYLFCLSTV